LTAVHDVTQTEAPPRVEPRLPLWRFLPRVLGAVATGFVAPVLVDYYYIRSRDLGVEHELLAYYAGAPAMVLLGWALYRALRPWFLGRSTPMYVRVIAIIGMTYVLMLVLWLPLLYIHFALGGQH
jgi:hypothetical protein